MARRSRNRFDLTCYGAPDVALMQFVEMKAKLEAAGVKTDFPIVESTQLAYPSDGDDALKQSDGTP